MVVNRVRVCLSPLRVDLSVVRVYGEPGLGEVVKPALGESIPLHRGAGVVTAGFQHVRDKFVGPTWLVRTSAFHAFFTSISSNSSILVNG